MGHLNLLIGIRIVISKKKKLKFKQKKDDICGVKGQAAQIYTYVGPRAQSKDSK